MKKKNWFYAIALAASLTWVACDDDDDNVLDPELNETDEEFVEWAAESNMAEIELGQLAATKGTHPAVRDFGQQMVDDHTAAQNELEAINDDFRGIDWPDDLEDEHENLRTQLNNATGAEFDSLYIRTQVNMHQVAITRYQTASTSASETRVKSYAEKHLPGLQEHHTRADSIMTVLTTEAANGGTEDGTADGGTTDSGTTDGTTDGGTTDGGTTDGGTEDGGTTDGGTDDGGTTDGGTDGGDGYGRTSG